MPWHSSVHSPIYGRQDVYVRSGARTGWRAQHVTQHAQLAEADVAKQAIAERARADRLIAVRVAVERALQQRAMEERAMAPERAAALVRALMRDPNAAR